MVTSEPWRARAEQVGRYVAIERALFGLVGRWSAQERFAPGARLALFATADGHGFRSERWEGHLPRRDGIDAASFVVLTEQYGGVIEGLVEVDDPLASLRCLYGVVLPTLASVYREQLARLSLPMTASLDRTVRVVLADLEVDVAAGARFL